MTAAAREVISVASATHEYVIVPVENINTPSINLVEDTFIVP
jgi:hypothetical protein